MDLTIGKLTDREILNEMVVLCSWCRGPRTHAISVLTCMRPEGSIAYVVDVTKFEDRSHWRGDITSIQATSLGASFGKRESVDIFFSCEQCPNHTRASLVQHKGHTIFDISKAYGIPDLKLAP